ncbi:MAG: SRPBCC domain-containing protein [Ardenticatenaceae bacterium]|nr:SRPBCC domain-containing protein [Anaerolineales bacterium]MCB8921834.1 SRPBCC domain-containing protein [Ardenticatenaceae bacterium]MCB8991008.1 SRPBCC domain-containing protein [Ardenticatenaceae bacterium]MCB9005312.1 SRPBCC domain-containing protein [Ardenticatenaceae bacterium]
MSKKSTMTYEVTVQAPAAAVYHAFTNQTALTQWLCNNAQVSAQVGDTLFLTWNQSNYYAVGEFTKLKENKRIAFTWRGRGEPGETAVQIKLEETDDATHITLKHKQIGKGNGWKFTRKQIDEGWSSSLANLKQVLETGLDRRIYERPFLGILIGGLVSAEEAKTLGLDIEGGVRITGTMPETGAAAAGLQNQDIITSLDDTPLITFPAIQSVLSQRKPGDVLATEFYRDGNKHTANLTLTKRPAPNVPDKPAELAEQLRSQYTTLAADLDDIVANASEEEASHPNDDQWSAKEILAHLITSERGMHMAIASNMDGNTLNGWPNNPRAWTKAYTEVYTFAAMADAFKHALDETLAIVANLPDELVARKATYFGVAQTLFGFAGHVRNHYPEMQQAIDAARAKETVVE